MFEKEAEELEKEKCELLGIIRAKDELIKKMKSCYNCKFDIDNGWLKHQPCLSCKKYNKWELIE